MNGKKQRSKAITWGNSMNDYQNKKPPLGLMPRVVYDERCNSERIEQILRAMARYSDAQMAIPMEWIKEIAERLQENYGVEVSFEDNDG